jgi:hypothetical protein
MILPSELMAIAAAKPHLFDEELWVWFWEQFDKSGGCGQFVNDSRLQHDESTLVEEHLARMVFEAFPCAPFSMKLYDKQMIPQADHQGALKISACDYSLWVGSVVGTSLYFVEFEWPESWSEASADGKTGSGGSHKSARFTFDLVSPTSLEMIRACVLEHCERIIKELRPKSDINHDHYPLFGDD